MIEMTSKLRKHGDTVRKIISCLDSTWFTKNPGRRKRVQDALKAIWGITRDDPVEKVSLCFEDFWTKYASPKVAAILKGFPKVERAYYGLELDEIAGARYRDHYIHMFNNFILGGLILSSFAKEYSNPDILKRVFQVEQEPDSVPFSAKYSAQERLYFLWTLASSFHDVGIPVEHLSNLPEGLNKYFPYFGQRILEFTVEQDASVACQMRDYFDLMSRMFDGGIITNAGVYKLADEPHPYVFKALADAIGKKDHGIISALCLLRNIERSFLVDRGDKYNLRNLGDFKLYNDYVLKHDVTRAALTIGLHNLKPEDYPRLFKIAFNKLPLTFLLILCDELQEYLRPEGIAYQPIMKLREWPDLEVCAIESASDTKGGPRNLQIRLGFSYDGLPIEDVQSILRQARAYAISQGMPPVFLNDLRISEPVDLGLPVSHLAKKYSLKRDELEKRLGTCLEKYLDKYWRDVKRRIESKLLFAANEFVRLTMDVQYGPTRYTPQLPDGINYIPPGETKGDEKSVLLCKIP
jgi:hypothetical protein